MLPQVAAFGAERKRIYRRFMDKRLQGHGAVLAANVIFGLGVPVTKLLLDHWVTPMGYMASRSLFAAVIFWAISFFVPKERVCGKDLAVILLGGLLGFVVSQTLTAECLKYTTPVYYSIIATLCPIATMLMAALFLGEKISGLKTIGVVLGIAGALTMVFANQTLGSGSNDMLGIAFGFLSLATWVAYLLITRKVSQKYSAVTQMKWVFLISAVVTVPLALGDLSANALYTSAWGWDGVAEMAFVVLFATALGYFAIPFAMRYLNATTVSVYTNLQPVVASVVAFAIGQDALTWDKPVAGVLVLLSAYVVTMAQARKQA